MELNEYQAQADLTDKQPGTSEHSTIVPILGLAGEAGTLASEYKKFLRDGPSHKLFSQQVCEELGDILWYLSNVASKFGLTLEDVATFNLRKTRDRFVEPIGPRFFDSTFPESEQLPREFEVLFREVDDCGIKRVIVTCGGKPVGNPLSDASYADDGYRFHDIFHLSYATYLGWSPVTRRNFKCKRRSSTITDEVEDGGRAWVFEEAITALCYDHARRHNFYLGINSLDFDLLKTIKSLTSGLEVHVRTAREWETAILSGFRVWRQLYEKKGGVVHCNLHEPSMSIKDDSLIESRTTARESVF
jgi:NTP pyrophosphatase (non-canonical NTP hydrolase)